MYSLIMGLIRMAFMLTLLLGAVWVIRVGQGEDVPAHVTGGLQWAMDKGKQYVWNAAGELFKN
jgi:hypothetical protein